MYSYEDRMKAVKLYIQYHYKAAAVIRELGYPDRHMLVKWHEEFTESGTLRRSRTVSEKYTAAQKRLALQHYHEHGRSITETVKALGYPGKTTFKKWLNAACPNRQKSCISGGAMVEYPQEKKEQAVIALCAREGTAQEVADTHGVSRVTLYEWKRQLLGKESACAMPKKSSHPKNTSDKATGSLTTDSTLEALRTQTAELEREKAELERRVYELRLENDILIKAADVIKKDQGINLDTLTNREKAVVIDALRDKYRLNTLLKKLQIAKSTYCYQEQCLRRADPYAEFRARIHEIFHGSGGCYGYRRIHTMLKREGMVISEKVVRRIMREDGLIVYCSRKRKYSSYIGEITPVVENVIDRDFHAELPNMKWLTDITEFVIPAGKIYLSPIVDCFDGLAVSWSIGTSPNSELVNSMLDTAISGLKEDEHPIVHSDRGGHYRWPGWISRMDEAGLTRSMSKKGCSPDNSACEGFFGRLKNEMFYAREWRGISVEEFIAILDRYLHWYNEKRIKMTLGGMSPIEYRHYLGIK